MAMAPRERWLDVATGRYRCVERSTPEVSTRRSPLVWSRLPLGVGPWREVGFCHATRESCYCAAILVDAGRRICGDEFAAGLWRSECFGRKALRRKGSESQLQGGDLGGRLVRSWKIEGGTESVVDQGKLNALSQTTKQRTRVASAGGLFR